MRWTPIVAFVCLAATASVARGAGAPPPAPSPVFLPPPVVGGCIVPDCYPARVVPPSLDWVVVVTGPPGARVVLRFEAGVPKARRRPASAGPAQWASARELVVPVGASRLTGITPSTRDPVVAHPRVVPGPGPDRRAVTLDIRQMAGDAIVNRYRHAWSAPDADTPDPAPGDTLRLIDRRDWLPTALALDGAGVSGFVNDAVQNAVEHTVAVGDFVYPVLSEVAAWSVCNAMALRDTLPWTAAPGDVASVSFASPVTVPLAVWSDVPAADAQLEIAAAVARANGIYALMGSGIRFVAGPVQPFQGNTAQFMCGEFCQTTTVGGHPVPSCPDWDALGGAAGTINVFLLEPSQSGVTAVAPGCSGPPACCGVKNTVVLFRGQAFSTTLAHELGHLLSLKGHPEWPIANLMSGGSELRNCLTLGQAFRANLDDTSVVNRYPLRSGAVRSCADAASSVACPPVTLDVPRPLRAWHDATCGPGNWPPSGEALAELVTWLTCDDCGRPRLVPYGRPIVRALETLIAHGPSASMTEESRRQLLAAHQLTQNAADICPGPAPGDVLPLVGTFVGLYQARLSPRVKSRAAIALADIGSPAAIEALTRALKRDLPPDLRRLIERLLASQPGRP